MIVRATDYFIFCIFYVALGSTAVSVRSVGPSVLDGADQTTETPDIAASSDADIPQDIQHDIIGWNWDEFQEKSTSFREPFTFSEFNRQVTKPRLRYRWFSCLPLYNPQHMNQFIQQASIEELKHENQVIVYHGEKLGIWLLQVLAKQLTYPHAKDWLPLRFDPYLVDVDASDLQNMIRLPKSDYPYRDHSPEFTAIGLSAHVNLMSNDPAESATLVFRHWSGFIGYSQQSIDDLLKYLDISTTLHAPVRERLTAMLYTVAWKMKWSDYVCMNPDYFESYFPSLDSNEIELIQAWRQIHSESPREKGAGVILQIVMPPELAEKYSYASGPLGKIKKQPFLKYYSKHKNKLDRDGQLRIAMGHPFTRYPSPVKIKALSPIFQDEQLMHLIHKMMKDTVRFIQQKK